MLMSELSLTGNVGEWSEVYVLLKLLAEGKLYSAKDNLRPDEELYFPLLKVMRKESGNKDVEFSINRESEYVYVTIDGNKKDEVPFSRFSEKAERLYEVIEAKRTTTFSVPDIEYFLVDLGCESIKAASNKKADITVQIHDPQTGYEPVCGFSIKSQLGNPSTLLNAGKTTNFAFRVEGLSQDEIERINSIEGKQKIISRINAIYEQASEVTFEKVTNETFARNLMLVDSRMPEIIAEALLVYYRDGRRRLKDIVDLLEKRNPLEFPSPGFYLYKVKKFLCAVALGLKPASIWDGNDEANGGYIIVTASGDVVAYSIYNRNNFEDYLLANTCLEKASTSRHEFASLYKADDAVYVNLNLQIRFV